MWRGRVKKSTNFFHMVFVQHCFIDDAYPPVLSSAQACKLLLSKFQVDLPTKVVEWYHPRLAFWILSYILICWICCLFRRTQLGYNRDNIYLGYRTRIVYKTSYWDPPVGKDVLPKYFREMGLDQVAYPDILRNTFKKTVLFPNSS